MLFALSIDLVEPPQHFGNGNDPPPPAAHQLCMPCPGVVAQFLHGPDEPRANGVQVDVADELLPVGVELDQDRSKPVSNR